MDVIIRLHGSMKDGLQENKLVACSGGRLHKQLCLRICGSGGEEGEMKKWGTGSNKKKNQETLKQKKIVCADSRLLNILLNINTNSNKTW